MNRHDVTTSALAIAFVVAAVGIAQLQKDVAELHAENSEVAGLVLDVGFMKGRMDTHVANNLKVWKAQKKFNRLVARELNVKIISSQHFKIREHRDD